MYYLVKVSRQGYDYAGTTYFFDTPAAAFSFCEDVFSCALPDEDGKLPSVTIWSERTSGNHRDDD